jgi:hypothetical protein
MTRAWFQSIGTSLSYAKMSTRAHAQTVLGIWPQGFKQKRPLVRICTFLKALTANKF